MFRPKRQAALDAAARNSEFLKDEMQSKISQNSETKIISHLIASSTDESDEFCDLEFQASDSSPDTDIAYKEEDNSEALDNEKSLVFEIGTNEFYEMQNTEMEAASSHRRPLSATDNNTTSLRRVSARRNRSRISNEENVPKETGKQPSISTLGDQNPQEVVGDSENNGRMRKKLKKDRPKQPRLEELHPELENIWEKVDGLSVIDKCEDPQPKPLKLKLLPFQLEGLHWLRNQERGSFKGGILADEMGMGKTIQAISLMVSEPRGKPNLVIAPTVALMQWKNEISLYTNDALTVFPFYGAARDIKEEVLMNYDIVLTTYSTVESVYRKQQSGFRRKHGVVKERSLIHNVKFYRIVLDEAHNIKDRSCNTARAVFALKSDRKLCLTGTPLQNRIGELFSLLRFLDADPFAYYFCKKCECKSLKWMFTHNINCGICGHNPWHHLCWFNKELLKPIQKFGNEDEGYQAFLKIQKLLKHLMLRRTKVERADDLGLPPRIVEIRRDLFNEEEEDLYTSLYSRSKRKFFTYLEQGVVLNNYANIFQLITRMRQMANHPDLVLAKKANSLVDRSERYFCRICDEIAEDAIESRCHHTFCRVCITNYITCALDDNPICPVCNISISIDLSQPALDSSRFESTRKSIINRIDFENWRSSTKIEALTEELFKLRSSDRTVKSIVFSQFTSMLDLIGWRLRRVGFSCVKLDGTMTPEARAATINLFSTDPEVTVFLVSLKAGGVALNLTEASQVFLVDPWWNPASEWQASDRVHRLGQKRPVKITRLVIENSIESKIIELQEKKAHMIDATISADETALNRLTPEDLGFLFST